ncbi:MAG: energy-coupling factor ABC transporter permease [Actinomycetota bacterium]|nr:energy-coupling factor ABC transporter permease [Actinomycetota bacterium]
MSHLHIPDGIIAPSWLIIGFLITASLLGLSLYKLKAVDLKNIVPKIGVLGAVMLLGMIVPLPILGYHLNLSVLAGIILGPFAAFISAFVVNLILALTGHGGITVVGLNALITGAEACFGFIFFRSLRRMISIKWAAFLTTFAALVLSTALMIGMVVMTGSSPGDILHIHGPDGDESHELEEGHHDEEERDGDEYGEISLINFAKIVVPLASIGWLIESFIIAEMVSFIGKVRPELIDGKER